MHAHSPAWCRYKLETVLPYPVKDEEGKAKFDKAKSVLEVVLPTQPPPLPQQAVRQAGAEVQPEREQGEGEDGAGAGQDTGDTHDSEGGDADVEGYVMVPSPHPHVVQREGCSDDHSGRSSSSSGDHGGGCSSSSGAPGADTSSRREGGSGHAPSQDSAGASGTGRGLTDNQRRWLELHDRQQQPDGASLLATSTSDAAQQLPSGNGTAVQGAACAFEAAPNFQGPKEGRVFRTGDLGLGYYPDIDPRQAELGDSNSSSGHAQVPAGAERAIAALRQAGVAGPMEAAGERGRTTKPHTPIETIGRAGTGAAPSPAHVIPHRAQRASAHPYHTITLDEKCTTSHKLFGSTCK